MIGDANAAKALLAAQEDKDPLTRAEVLRALGRMQVREALQTIQAALNNKDEDPAVRQAADEAIKLLTAKPEPVKGPAKQAAAKTPAKT